MRAFSYSRITTTSEGMPGATSFRSTGERSSVMGAVSPSKRRRDSPKWIQRCKIPVFGLMDGSPTSMMTALTNYGFGSIYETSPTNNKSGKSDESISRRNAIRILEDQAELGGIRCGVPVRFRMHGIRTR